MKFNIDFISGPCIEITEGDENKFYTVKFIDVDKGDVVYESPIKTRTWVRVSRKWYTKWRIILLDGDNVITDYTLDLTKHIVRINIISKAMGDNLGWMPYIEEFRKKHNCRMVCSTHYNNLFRNVYKNIRFVNPGEDTSETDVVYNITYFDEDELPGWEWGGQMNPSNPYKVPLQKIATDILGLDYIEEKPLVYVDKKTRRNRLIKEKYVCISEHSTAKAKLWNNENGWQELVDYLNGEGYKVVAISREPTKLKGVLDRTGNMTLEYRIKQLYHCDFFIGLGSGLGWLAWALGKKVVMISGFSDPDTEFKSDNIRIINEGVCNGCFSKYKFIKSDWEWCPVHKGTERQFECTKSITSEMVIEKINYEILNDKKMINVPVSNGEIVDKVTILHIKMQNILDKDKLDNIINEYNTLYPIMVESIFDDENGLYKRLLDINKKLWDIEDDIRDKERDKEFDDEFIELARSVYVTNDERSEVKKLINKTTGCGLVEEKSYKKYN